MAWSRDQLEATTFKLTTPITAYRSAVANRVIEGVATSYVIPEGAIINATYDEDEDAMVIVQVGGVSSEDAALFKGKKIPSNFAASLAPAEEGEVVTTPANTTTDEATGEQVPENTTSTGEVSGSSTDAGTAAAEMLYLDNAFIDREYYKVYDDDSYNTALSEGLRVKDLRGVLGMPHQFTEVADPRIESVDGVGSPDEFGRVYAEKIVSHIPLLLMTPGIPVFMAGFSEDQKSTIMTILGIGEGDETGDSLKDLLGDVTGKYYSLKFSYVEYFKYVDAMLVSAATFLDIGNIKIDGTPLSSGNWLYRTSSMGNEEGIGGGIFGHEKLSNFLGPYAGCIAFYADGGTSVDESFGNTTTESQLASGLNSISDQAREVNFFAGNVGSHLGLSINSLTGGDDVGQQVDSLKSKIDSLMGGGSILSTILNKATTILAGGRLIFPEIWADSSFSRSYSCSMKLVSPSGDKLSIFLNILVPLYHLLAFTLPRQAMQQAYFSPFLVRAYYRGLFNVDMGIIPGLSVTKGEEGEWSIDGIPTVCNISFEIKDLYDGLYMSKESALSYNGIISNIAELDYIANTCGININDQEVARTIRLAGTFLKNIPGNISTDIFGGITQYFNQKLNNIFGVF